LERSNDYDKTAAELGGKVAGNILAGEVGTVVEGVRALKLARTARIGEAASGGHAVLATEKRVADVIKKGKLIEKGTGKGVRPLGERPAKRYDPAKLNEKLNPTTQTDIAKTMNTLEREFGGKPIPPGKKHKGPKLLDGEVKGGGPRPDVGPDIMGDINKEPLTKNKMPTGKPPKPEMPNLKLRKQMERLENQAANRGGPKKTGQPELGHDPLADTAPLKPLPDESPLDYTKPPPLKDTAPLNAADPAQPVVTPFGEAFGGTLARQRGLAVRDLGNHVPGAQLRLEELSDAQRMLKSGSSAELKIAKRIQESLVDLGVPEYKALKRTALQYKRSGKYGQKMTEAHIIAEGIIFNGSRTVTASELAAATGISKTAARVVIENTIEMLGNKLGRLKLD
jgi:hypothetical protein